MTTASAAAMDRRRPVSWVMVLLWCALTIALAVTLPRLPWRQAVDVASQSIGWWIAAALAANWLVLPLWAAEWRTLAPSSARVTYRSMFDIVAITAAILNSIPFFAGEASAYALLGARAGLSRSAALSVIAMDQLLVGFAKLVVLTGTVALAPLPPWLRTAAFSLVGAVSVLALALVLLAHQGQSLRERAAAGSLRGSHLLTRLAEWGAHLETLTDATRMRRVATLAIGKKLAELAGIVAIQLAFGLEVSIPGALLVLSAVSLATMIPVAPANLAVYEAAVFATYRFLGVASEAALGMAVVQHLCFLLPPLATGYLTLVFRPFRSATAPAS